MNNNLSAKMCLKNSY